MKIIGWVIHLMGFLLSLLVSAAQMALHLTMNFISILAMLSIRVDK